jgi:hypothetical protein
MRFMNYIRHLSAFFDRIAVDERIHPTHISLYMALFQFWNHNRFQNPISISRTEMMVVSKIQAKATYHKVIKELHEFGLIVYRPSYNPFRGSEVELVQWAASPDGNKDSEETSTGSESEPTVNKYPPKIGTATVPLNEPPYKHINYTNDKLAYDEDTSSDSGRATEQAKTDLKKITPGGGLLDEGRANLQMPPQLHEVEAYFEEIKSTKLEGEKFFNYFQSNGWKVGGRAAMKDWQASARNWILNANAFSKKKKPATHQVLNGKNYGEPL